MPVILVASNSKRMWMDVFLSLDDMHGVLVGKEPRNQLPKCIRLGFGQSGESNERDEVSGFSIM